MATKQQNAALRIAFGWYVTNDHLPENDLEAQAYQQIQLPCYQDRLLPFQILLPGILQGAQIWVSSWTIRTTNGTVVADVTNFAPNVLAYVSSSYGQHLIYKATGQLANLSLNDGCSYYSVIEIGNFTLYSDVFKAVSGLDRLVNSGYYLRLEWANSCDIMPLIYSTGYTNLLFLNTRTQSTAPTLTEEVEKDGNGEEIPTQQSMIFKRRIETFATDNLSDALSLMSIHNSLFLTERGLKLSPLRPVVTPTYEDGGHFGSVAIDFELPDSRYNNTGCCNNLDIIALDSNPPQPSCAITLEGALQTETDNRTHADGKQYYFALYGQDSSQNLDHVKIFVKVGTGAFVDVTNDATTDATDIQGRDIIYTLGDAAGTYQSHNVKVEYYCANGILGASQTSAYNAPSACVNVDVDDSAALSAKEGVFFQIAIPYTGTPPVDVINVTKPAWLSNPIIGVNSQSTGGAINFNGTPPVGSAGSFDLKFDVENCNASGLFSYEKTGTIAAAASSGFFAEELTSSSATTGGTITANWDGGTPPFSYRFIFEDTGTTCSTHTLNSGTESGTTNNRFVSCGVSVSQHSGDKHVIKFEVRDANNNWLYSDDFEPIAINVSCLVPETDILLADGTTKKLADVQTGDLLADVDPITRKARTTRVTGKAGYKTGKTVVIIAGGKMLESTLSHLHVVKNLNVAPGFEISQAEFVTKDDILFDAAGNEVIVDGVVISNAEKDVINIETETETYIANGILTHNKSFC